MAPQDSELGLVKRAAAGDQEALERLLFAYYDRVRALLERKLPVSFQGIISEEDIVQQTFMQAFLDIPTFEPRGSHSFYRWLATIARHRLLDAIKAQRSARRGGDRQAAGGAAHNGSESIFDLLALLPGTEHTASQSVAGHEAQAAVQVALAGLKDDYRRAIHLRHIEGRSVAEVAKTMNRTPRAIHNLCHRGLKELRAVMGSSSQFLTKK